MPENMRCSAVQIDLIANSLPHPVEFALGVWLVSSENKAGSSLLKIWLYFVLDGDLPDAGGAFGIFIINRNIAFKSYFCPYQDMITVWSKLLWSASPFV